MYRLTSGSPTMTIADVAERRWVTIIGCGDPDHAVRWTPEDLVARFPSSVTLGQVAERLICSHCGSTSGEIGFVQGAAVRPSSDDERAPTGLGRSDTLNMGEVWDRVSPRRPGPEKSPTGFGRPRNRR